MKKIIIDTNGLMAISEFKLDLFSAIDDFCDFKYQLTVLSGTVYELKKIIEEQRGKYKAAARLALGLIRLRKVVILESNGNVDDELVQYSIKGSLVLTQDFALKKRLAKPYLTIRQKKKVILVK